MVSEAHIEEIDSSVQRRIRFRLLGLAGVISTLGTISVLLVVLNAHQVEHDLGGLGGLTVPAFILFGSLLTLALFPIPLTAAGAGLLFGTLAGAPIALMSLSLGATLSAVVARLAVSDKTASALGRRTLHTAEWLEGRSFRALLVARALPGVPFALLSFAAGLTRVSFATFAAATALGIAPRVFAYTALGGSLGHLDRPEAKAAIAATVVVTLAGLLVPVLMRRRVSRGEL
jgi:uncharacterized membrane protein YdjX (TVP38/TMEM64 family)